MLAIAPAVQTLCMLHVGGANAQFWRCLVGWGTTEQCIYPVMQGFPKLTKSSIRFPKILLTSADLKSRLYKKVCQNWLLNSETSSHSEG